MAHEAHVCAVCRTVLDWREPLNGSAGNWQHNPVDRTEDDHEPVPVPRREITEVRDRCDYCGDANPVCIFVLAERPQMAVLDEQDEVVAGTEDVDGMWGACAECAALVEAGSAAKLTTRVARAIEASRGEPIMRDLLYKMYVHHLSIPRIRVDAKGDVQ